MIENNNDNNNTNIENKMEEEKIDKESETKQSKQHIEITKEKLQEIVEQVAKERMEQIEINNQLESKTKEELLKTIHIPTEGIKREPNRKEAEELMNETTPQKKMIVQNEMTTTIEENIEENNQNIQDEIKESKE